MKYWDEFIDRYGFGDGDSIPTDAWETREQIVRVVNEKARALGSRFELYAEDVSSLHNDLLIGYRSLDGVVDGDNWDNPDIDDAMFKAIAECNSEVPADGELWHGNSCVGTVSVSIEGEPMQMHLYRDGKEVVVFAVYLQGDMVVAEYETTNMTRPEIVYSYMVAG